MIGKDEEQEEVTFKVADRRKFNADGSLKEGVEIAPEPAPEPKPSVSESVQEQPDDQPTEAPQESAAAEDQIPGADDPASFINFLSTLATNAAASLGAMPHPATGQVSLDLDGAKYWLDILAMLKEKTKGNLHPKEEKLFDGLLRDMRMQYVHLVRATEEKLKAQAAAKFTGDDILGCNK
ncbi:MAG: DUF1844 domain-containing protein [Acidobacteria bacterium]|nr:DUF1844 domain-containing protein [Acidobacteriota bacterium]